MGNHFEHWIADLTLEISAMYERFCCCFTTQEGLSSCPKLAALAVAVGGRNVSVSANGDESDLEKV